MDVDEEDLLLLLKAVVTMGVGLTPVAHLLPIQVLLNLQLGESSWLNCPKKPGPYFLVEHGFLAGYFWSTNLTGFLMTCVSFTRCCCFCPIRFDFQKEMGSFPALNLNILNRIQNSFN